MREGRHPRLNPLFRLAGIEPLDGELGVLAVSFIRPSDCAIESAAFATLAAPRGQGHPSPRRSASVAKLGCGAVEDHLEPFGPQSSVRR